jgi:hypothetical protein
MGKRHRITPQPAKFAAASSERESLLRQLTTALDHEPLIPLSQAAAWIGNRTGRRPNISTLHRWALRGCRGVRLETQAVGHVRYTSEAAILRFLNAKPIEPQAVVAVEITSARAPTINVIDDSVSQLRRRVFKGRQCP